MVVILERVVLKCPWTLVNSTLSQALCPAFHQHVCFKQLITQTCLDTVVVLAEIKLLLLFFFHNFISHTALPQMDYCGLTWQAAQQHPAAPSLSPGVMGLRVQKVKVQ